MSRQNGPRLSDISDAITAIRRHLARGDLHDGMVYDAVRVRLIEIGESVKGIDPDLLGHAADIPWKEIALMRDLLAHRYFDTDHAIVQDVLRILLTGGNHPLRETHTVTSIRPRRPRLVA